MKPLVKISLSTLIALPLAFAFNVLFLDLLHRPFIDQILLMFFSAAACGYLIFSLWGSRLKINLPRFEYAAFRSFIHENAPGILLAFLFFGIYLWLGLRLNFPDRDTTDNFLDADNFPWVRRIADFGGFAYEMRGPHPFAYFILRPIGLALNLFLHDPTLSAVLLNTLVGAFCVLFAWMIINRRAQNATYALLMASLLGLSTAHLFLGAVVETYIFSAAAMMFFLLLLQSRQTLAWQVGASLLTFGITLTNFIPNLIAFAVQSLKEIKSLKDSLKAVIHFAGLTLSLGVLFSLLHAAWYPASKLFFLLSDAQAEQTYALSVFTDPSWRVVGRIILLLRTIFLYAVIAPKPYVFIHTDGGDFPRFNFFKIIPGTFSHSAYSGLGDALMMAWVALLLLAGAMFLLQTFRAKKLDLPFAFALSLLFNFALHINYGYEPFLYSPDWTHALVFFVAFSLSPLAKYKLLQIGLLLFLLLLAYNQLQFFQFIFTTIAPYLN